MKTQIKLIEDGKVPIKGEPEAMCYDCYARKIEQLEDGKIKCYLGFAATPPKGYGIRLISRSNITKHWWVLNNGIGIGDPNYKSEYLAIFTPIPMQYNEYSEAFTCKSFPYKVNDRVCQMEIYKKEEFEFDIVEELEGKDRGGGFGATGIN